MGDPKSKPEKSGNLLHRSKGLRLELSGIQEEETFHEWVVELEMFRDCPEPIPLKGAVKAEGSIYKSGTTVYFTAQAQGAFDLVCSRCARDFEAPFKAAVNAIFLPRKEEPGAPVSEEDAGEVETAYYDGETVDLFLPLRDQVTLAEPMRPLCMEDCKGLCPRCGADWNEAACDCSDTSGDPRFAELKKLFKTKEG
ncbi:MAG: DUF177 domain-containing protein [Nitrospinota bacterium]|nr:DUF177 domain-containing protein [Nitrospinota bacterium]MDH5678597.1 DUF177 domain-containing protein [Nitrospinota bacterium]